jgi:tRNA pseudouridine38-40 synthase
VVGAATTTGGRRPAPAPSRVAATPANRVRLRLLVAYDGGSFRGFAAQPGQRTVAGELSRAVTTVVGHDPGPLVCAGRTDAGVHARGQVVHVDVPAGTDPAALARAVNAMVGPDVVVRGCEVADPGFDARRGARGRVYRYLVLEAATPDPLLAPVSWTVSGPLDLRAMRAAADAVLGEHDFRAFCRRAPGTSAEDPITREVTEARWSEVGWPGAELGPSARLLRFDVAAGSFCHQMVRSLVGAMVEVGRGRRRAADVHWLLRAGDRSLAPEPAPPQGLCLVAVHY